ncbi:hypothetical protein [Mesorhizobium retamae]|uniref:DUF680 domain-containing protein n=1 Tax=Mesorhizobium retamae TaxID=2912854 RepID=A0ABS9QCG2_9HYPH|nr:hypothetical protein [Mesorhizobium sp. IRAMC:0171]MCG7505113.1 hypothetical protein [Mesorhizobium sp. IRAMC:0171]
MNKIVLTATALLVAASGSAFAANATHVKKPSHRVVEQVDPARTSSIASPIAAPRVSPTDQDPFTMPDAGYGQGIWGQ